MRADGMRFKDLGGAEVGEPEALEEAEGVGGVETLADAVEGHGAVGCVDVVDVELWVVSLRCVFAGYSFATEGLQWYYWD